jgi:hypothetical protein
MELREVCAGLLGSSELVRFNRPDPEIGRGPNKTPEAFRTS